MNLIHKFFALTILSLTCVFNQAQAQVIKADCVNGINPLTLEPCSNPVTSAVPFLRIVPDARSGSMGDAGIATSTDPNAMHFNQSKLAFAEQDVAFSATYTPWMRALGLQDVYLAYLSGYKQIDDLQTIGASLRYFSLGNIMFTDNNGQSLGEGNPNEFEVSVAYSRKLSDKLSAGIGGKFIYSNLANNQRAEGTLIKAGKAGAADLSLTYKTPVEFTNTESEFTFGAAITNIGSKITYTQSINREFIPTNLGIGLGWKFNFDEFNSLLITTDFNKLLVPTPVDIDEDPQDNIPDYKQVSPISGIFKSFGDAPGGFPEELKEINMSAGLEYWYDNQFALRAGYFNENYSKGNRRYATVGVGVKYNVFGINLSYLVPTTNQRNPLDNTLRFSFIFDFSAFDEE